MKILLINHYAGSPFHGMEFRPHYMAREWAKEGHTVQILAASYSHIRARQPALSGAVLDEDISNIPYRWYATPSFSGNGIGRVLNILTFIRSLTRDAKKIASEFQPDVVIASSTYPMDIWPAKRIAKLAAAKLVFEVHDLWPLSPIELGGMSRFHPFILWVQVAEDYAYKHADKVVSMLPCAKEHMCSRGMAEEKFVYVPNGVNEEEWVDMIQAPMDVMNRVTDLRAIGLPIVCYAGTLGLANALDVLLDAAVILKGKAQILLVGIGPDRERLQLRVEKEKLTNVSFSEAIPKQAMPSFLAAIDIAYIGLLPQPIFRFGISPNKLMDYMMAARPIVMSIASGNDPVTEAGCGYTVPPGDAVAVSRAIMKLIAMPPETREGMGKRGREQILKNQTYPVLARKMISGLDATGGEF